MSDWTSGYVADIGYTYGYYAELNPLRARLAFLNNGLTVPKFGTACELGFGQGLSTNLHAAASETEWYGTDFNPAQAGFAQELAGASGASAKLYDDAFTHFCSREELPDFDFIGLHGIWSWISDENREIIVDFVRRKLKVGGVLYTSYNTLPGWSNFAPMRHLLTRHAELIGAEGHGIVSRIDGALGFAEKLLESNPSYLKVNPQVKERMGKIKDQNRHYLAHEYFNRDWHPMYFADMKDWLEPAKVDFACSAHYLDHVSSVNFTADQQKFLTDIPDNMLRQSVRDFMVNQQFRRDYWVRGARKLSSIEQGEQLKAEKIVLIVHRPDVSLKVTGSLGEATMSEAIYNPILDILADHQARTIGQLEVQLKDSNISFAQLIQAVMVLASSGQVTSVQDDETIQKTKKQTENLNLHLLHKARNGGEVGNLVSPVTGGGIPLPRIPQLFLLAIKKGKKDPEDWVQIVWSLLSLQGQLLIKEGKNLETAEENIEELRLQAKGFQEKVTPVLKALKIL